MRDSKLYIVLKQFNKFETNRLKKFVASPYFNADETLVQLFQLLTQDIASGAKDELTKELIWKKLLHKSPYDDVRFRKYFSDLLKLVENFLAQEVFEENPLHRATYLIEAISKRKLERLYNSSMNSARRLSEQQELRPASYYYYQYEIEKLYYDLTESELKRAAKSNVEVIANYLDYFYLAEKLKYYCAVKGQQYFISHEYKLLFIEEILEHLKQNQYDAVPPIAIYYQILLTQLETANADAHYYKLKKLLEENYQLFSKKEALSMYYSAMNYCIRMLNVQKGNQEFLAELFDLYNFLITKEVLFINGELSPWDFKNIVSTGITVKKFDWTEQFIHDHSEKIPEQYRKNAVTYNLAILYFYQKKYAKVIELLREVEYNDITYDVNSRGYLIMTYYEMDEIEPLNSLIESFRVFLNRQKNIPTERKKYTLSFLKFVKKLSSVLPGEKKKLTLLKEEVQKNKQVTGQSWLLEKISELEG